MQQQGYLHPSRHKWAKGRKRGPGGRFLSKDEVQRDGDGDGDGDGEDEELIKPKPEDTESSAAEQEQDKKRQKTA